MPTHSSNDTVFSGLNVFLQSKDGQTDENGSNCDFYLDTIIEAPRQDLSMLVSVIDAEIPYSFYNVTSKNNTLTINGQTISIEEKNYSVFNIVDAFNEKFTLNSALQSFNISMTFDDNTNKFKIQSSTQITINSTTMTKELGFTSLPITTTTYTANQCCNLAGSSSVYIRSGNMNIKNINSFGKTNGVLCKVLVNSSPGNFIFYQPNTPQYFVLGNSLNFINIQLKNDDDDFFNFNGLDWSLTISIEYFRRRDDTINYKYFLSSVEDRDSLTQKEQQKKQQKENINDVLSRPRNPRIE